MSAVLYIHGKNGSAAESGHYRPFFPGEEVVGLDYRSSTPWEAGPEIRRAAEELRRRHGSLTLIANSIGAYFSLWAGIGHLLRRAFFISPVVDMERLIQTMMDRSGVTEEALRARGVIPTPFGEDLSWDYLCRVRAHPVRWDVPTAILYGARDALVSPETVSAFAERCGATLTVMENGEHWFHTGEQMAFLDRWLRDSLSEKAL